MKYLQFINTASRSELDGATVAAWSVRRRGNLPENTRYILYTQEPEKARQDETAAAVFDAIEPPPVDMEWFKSRPWNLFRVPHRRYILKNRRFIHWVLWLKFCCWLDTPTDGEPVIFADYDTLCFGSIREAIPGAGYKYAGRRNVRTNGSCNGGFLIKTPEFTEKDAAIMKEPLRNVRTYAAASFLWRYDDEMATAWYAKEAGMAHFYPLEPKFNRRIQAHVKVLFHHIPIEVKGNQRHTTGKGHGSMRCGIVTRGCQ